MSSESQLFPEDLISPKEGMLPLEVVIVTPDHEIKGLVYVSRKAKSERRLSDLLNDQRRRFLAITDAELVNRHSPSAPRRYAFLQVHIDSVVMLHPSTQRMASEGSTSKDDAARLDQFRTKIRGVELS